MRGKALSAPLSPTHDPGFQTGGAIWAINNGTVAAQNIVTSLPSIYAVNYFDTSTCYGVMSTNGTLYSRALGTNAYAAVGPLPAVFDYVVSQNGAVITLTERGNGFAILGYPIRLERP